MIESNRMSYWLVSMYENSLSNVKWKKKENLDGSQKNSRQNKWKEKKPFNRIVFQSFIIIFSSSSFLLNIVLCVLLLIYVFSVCHFIRIKKTVERIFSIYSLHSCSVYPFSFTEQLFHFLPLEISVLATI